MRIILVRHADAEDYAGSDFQRKLTPKGRKQSKKVSKFLSSIADLGKALLIYSPYLRAAQTAEIIMENSVIYYTAIEDERLGCGMTPEEALDVVKEVSFEDTVLLVGHQPDLGEFMAYLLGTSAAALNVGKASVVIFEIDGLRPGGGRLEAFIPAKYL